MSRIVLPFVVIAFAAGIGAVLLKTPQQVSKSAPQQVSAVVGVAELRPQDERVFIEAFGTVVAAREVRIQPEVTGCVVELPPELTPGGLIPEGATLFKIETADYEIAVAQAEAELKVARLQIDQLRASVEALRGRVRQTEAELKYLKWNAERIARLSESDQAGEAETRDAQSRLESQRALLSALKAQIVEEERAVDSAEAGTGTAESRLAAAKLALARTQVAAPFDAIVLDEAVELGQLVGPQNVVARLAATDEFWVEAAIPIARLPEIPFAINGDESRASCVTVTLVTGETNVSREGFALRPLGQLDPQGRMARVLIAIRDPLDLQNGRIDERKPILLGSYVRLAIDAGVRTDVYAIPRYALRENNRVWVRDKDGKLGIRDVQILWRRPDDVLVRDEFSPGDKLVTTHLASVVPGMPLDIREEETSASAANDQDDPSDDS
jgi:multidrug efflux pump subunit AcrA (membrane-fusion protein)